MTDLEQAADNLRKFYLFIQKIAEGE